MFTAYSELSNVIIAVVTLLLFAGSIYTAIKLAVKSKIKYENEINAILKDLVRDMETIRDSIKTTGNVANEQTINVIERVAKLENWKEIKALDCVRRSSQIEILEKNRESDRKDIKDIFALISAVNQVLTENTTNQKNMVSDISEIKAIINNQNRI